MIFFLEAIWNKMLGVNDAAVAFPPVEVCRIKTPHMPSKCSCCIVYNPRLEIYRISSSRISWFVYSNTANLYYCFFFFLFFFFTSATTCLSLFLSLSLCVSLDYLLFSNCSLSFFTHTHHTQPNGTWPNWLTPIAKPQKYTAKNDRTWPHI